MTVSVVIPYSSEHTSEEMLERAKNSVRQQSVDTEILVQEENGVAAARNAGLDQASNRYVAFLDADDYWTEDKLDTQLRHLRNSDAGFSITGREEDGELRQVYPRPDRHFIRDVFLQQVTGFTSTMLVDTEQVDVRFDEELYRREDHLYTIQAAAQAGVCIVNQPFTVLDKHSEGLTATEDPARKMAANRRVFQEATATCPWLERFKHDYFWYAYHRVGRDQFYSGDYTRSTATLLKAARYQPRLKTLGAAGLSAGKAVFGGGGGGR